MSFFCVVLTLLGPLVPPHFPYTTLFRSPDEARGRGGQDRGMGLAGGPAARAGVAADDGARVRRRRAVEDLGQRRRERSEEHTSELQSLRHLVCRPLLEKKNKYHISLTRQ